MKKNETGTNYLYTFSGPRIKFRERLVRFWTDLHDDQRWKYDELAPVEPLQKAEFHCQTVLEAELARVNWFWRRRPKCVFDSRLDFLVDCGHGSVVLGNVPILRSLPLVETEIA